MPKYHGRAHVEIIGEELESGTIVPPRFRPLPNSPVFPLSMEETSNRLKLNGDITLGLVIGYESLEVNLPSDKKSVLPRHLGILGTTGGGKSTTVSGLIGQFQKAGVATIVFDTEGEYTEISDPTDDESMIGALERRELRAEGVENVHIMHLTGRDTTNPTHENVSKFSLAFENLSPYAVMEIIDLTEAQQARYLAAYDAAKHLLRTLGIFPDKHNPNHENMIYELDEMERGYFRLTLQRMYDIVAICGDIIQKEDRYTPRDTTFKAKKDVIVQHLKSANLPKSYISWRALQGKLGRLLRLKIFDIPEAQKPNYEVMSRPGTVTLIDLGDTDSPQINNLVIAELLRGIQQQQELNYQNAEAGKEDMRRVTVIIEEAHEFLSASRIRQMPVLFQQVARIARRGRKRWLGLVFVTQLPQHLPNEVLGLINSYILHKISDANVISQLKRSIGGIDDTLWDRLRNLAPGQAIVNATSLARPLMVAIDPTPSKLRMVE
jgi:hypothetical protein